MFFYIKKKKKIKYPVHKAKNEFSFLENRLISSRVILEFHRRRNTYQLFIPIKS